MEDASRDPKKGIERITLVDLSSSEDDLLISSSSSFSSISVDGSLAAGKSDVNGPTNALVKENSENCSEETKQGPVQPKKRAPEKLNLRKSLAWDNAFFTSEGVLDSEELAMVNSTFRKAEPHVLPVIEEDMRSSFESTTTFDSDNLTVESIESELFGNLRASIQKSYDKCDQAATIEQPGKTAGSRKAEVRGSRLHEQASTKTEISSKIGGKPPMALKRDGIAKSRPNENPKELSSSQKAASGKGNEKLVTKQQTSGFTSAPIRPGATTAPIKKAPIPQLIQVERNTRKAPEGNARGRPSGIPTSEKLRVVPKSSHGSSNLRSSNKGLLSASCSSNSRPGRISDQTRKISLDPSRKKIDNKNSVKSSSSSGMKSPLISESKINAKCQRTDLKFSAVSPSSSIESVESLCSSASTATIGTHSLSSYGSEGISSQPSEDKSVHHRLSDMEINISGAAFGDLSVGSSPGASFPKVSGPSDDQYASVNATSETKLSKPSGLRIPRPKIGYFDAEKSLTGNSSKSQVASQSAILGSTSTIGRSSGMLKSTSSEAPLKSIKTPSPLCSETVLQPTASLPVSTNSKVGDPVATAATEMPSRFSHDQTVMVNDHAKESNIQEDGDSGADESRKAFARVGDGVDAAGYDSYSTSDAGCLDPHELSVAPAKASGDKLQEISVSLELNFKENNFTKKASLTSEKPSSIPSPCISKNVLGHQENIYGQLTENIGKENLPLLGNQMG